MKILKAFVCFGLIFTLNFSPLLVFAEDSTQLESAPISEARLGKDTPQDQPTDEVGQIEAPKNDDSSGGSKIDPVETPPETDSIKQTQSSQFALPSGVKTPELTYQQKINSSVDTFSGALLQSVPIEIPKGRNGVQPDLSLQYNSQNLDTFSEVGSGWALSIPTIERFNKTGIEKLYIDNYFTSSLSGELASTSNPTVFRAKQENGDFLKYTFSANTWTVLDKNGLTYTFGSIDASRQYSVANTASTTKWMLTEVRDTNNNFYRYEYVKDGNEIYPSKVLYTGTGAEDGIYSVEFVLENRPDTYVSYKNGYKVEIKKRLKDIVIKVSGVERGRYSLGYTSGANGVKSLLASVVESKVSATGQTISLPATTFEYANDPVTYALRDQNFNTATRDGYDRNGYAVVDLDGNGLNERLSSIMVNDSNPNQGGQLGFILNKGTNHTENLNKIIQRAWSINGENAAVDFANLGTRIFDVNGDLLPDLVYSSELTFGWGPLSRNQIYLNTGGNDFATTTYSEDTFPTFKYGTYSGGSGSGSTGAVLIANINGDSLVDTYSVSSQCTSAQGPGAYNGYCSTNGPYIGTGSGWKVPAPQNVNGGQIPGQEFPPIFLFADVNGDGLDDRIQQYDASTTVAYLNLGDNTWSDVPSPWSIPQPLQREATFNYDQGVRLVDINGDGLVDILRSYYIDYPDNTQNDSFIYTGRTMPLPAKGNIHVVYLNTGSLWQEASNLSTFNIIDNIEILATHWRGKFLINDSYFDANGDGLVDFGNNIRQGRKPDMLVKTTYSTGGTSQVEYKSTAAEDYGNTYQTNPNLPSVIYAVSKITKDSGNGSPEVSDYMYEGGKNDFRGPDTLKFAGFKKVTETKGNRKTITYFHQGDDSDSTVGEVGDEYGKIGKVFKEVLTDLVDHVYKTTWYNWTSVDQGQGRHYTYLASTLEQLYDGNATHKDVAVGNVFDTATGNLTQKTEYGEVVGANDGTFTDTGNDKRVTAYNYATNGTLTLPSEVTMTDANNALVQKTRLYYDTLPLGTVSLGNQTKVEQAITTSTYAVSTKIYNSFGLVTQEKDPNNNATGYVYDTYNLFPATLTNALSQATQYTYDYLSGKPLTVTTPNNVVFTNTYDGLGRQKEEKIPDPYGNSVTKTTYEYTDTPNAILVKRSDYLDESNIVDSYTYFDSLGRKLQTKKEAEFGNWITNDFAYDAQGQLSKESLPYFTTTNTNTSPTTNPRLYTFYTYDSLNRATHIGTAAGDTMLVYDNWQKTVTDPLSHVKKYVFDARNNLAQVVESLGLTDYVTTYAYDSNNNLTKITDANGNIRNFTYDLLGRRKTAEDLHAVNDAIFGVYTFGYDNAGNVLQKNTPNGAVINYTYDVLNRAKTEDYTGQSGLETLYSYDTCLSGIGMLCTVEKPSYLEVFEYTKAGLVGKDTKTIHKVIFESSFVYDRQGNTVQNIAPNTDVVYYGYNNAGLLESIFYSRSGIKTMGAGALGYDVIGNIDYSPLSQISYQQNGNGTETCNTYDANTLYRLINKKTGTQGLTCSQNKTTPVVQQPIDISGSQSASASSISKNQVPPQTYTLPDGSTMLVTKEKLVPNDPSTDDVEEYLLGWKSDGSQIRTMEIRQKPKIQTSQSGKLPEITLGEVFNKNLITISDGTASFTISPISGDGVAASGSKASQSESGTEYKNVFGLGIDANITGDSVGLTKDIVIAEPNSLKTTTGTYVDFTFAIRGDAAMGIEVNGTELHLGEVATTTQSAFVLIDDNRYQIAPGKITDSRENATPKLIQLVYEKRADGIYVTKRISRDYLLDALLVYPVKTDLSIVFASPNVSVTFPSYYETYNPSPWTWETIHEMQYGGTPYGGDMYIGAEKINGIPRFQIQRGFLSFDTAALPDNATLVSGTLKVTALGNSVSHDQYSYINVVQGMPATPGATDIFGYSRCGDAATNPTKGAQDFAFADVPDQAPDGLVLNLTSVAHDWISKTEDTQLCLRSGNDIENVQPSASITYSNLRLRNVTNPPKLSLVYTVPGSSQPGGFDQTSTSTMVATTTTPLQDIGYTYDAVGNILKIVDTSNTTLAKTVDYTYDPLYRLESASSTSAHANYKETYTYDGIGNILQRNNNPYSYGGILYDNPHAVTQIGLVSLGYDANGNLATMYEPTATTTNMWNYKNELVATNKGASSIAYDYDQSGTRVYKEVNTTNQSFYPSPFYNLVGTTTTSYVYVGDTLLVTIEKPIDKYPGGAPSLYWDHTDHLGGVTLTTNSAGQLVESTDYLPYGKERETSTANNHQEQRKYIGQYHDSETDFNYLNARYYVGVAGRFISQDPVFWENQNLLNPQSLNSYSYAEGNPITRKDPSGRVAPLIAALYFAAPYITAGLEYAGAALTAGFLAHDVGTITGTALSNAPGSYKSEVYNGVAENWGTGLSVASQLSPLVAGEARTATRSTLQANKTAGDAFEELKFSELNSTADFPQIQPQVTLRTQSGTRTRMDIIARDSSGKFCLFECKSSATAPLTKNQSTAFPEILKTGATVVGKGKEGFPGGTFIPPTSVKILRP